MICLSHGSSMLPTFGKLNIIRIVKKSNYVIGDIVSFKGNNNKFYCHRIIEINNVLVSTKGDNLDQQEYEKNIPIKNIDGLVTLICRIF